MRRWKLKLIVGGILSLILIIFVFVPFNVEAYSNQGYQFIAYKSIITDSGGEEVNEINIIADLSSEKINFYNFTFSIPTYLNKSWSASYGNEVDLDLMEVNSYYLINRLLNYDDEAYFVTKLSEPFENLEAILDYLGISYNQGVAQGYQEGYTKGFSDGELLGGTSIPNVFDKTYYRTITNHGVTATDLKNGFILLNGTATSTGHILCLNQYNFTTNYFPNGDLMLLYGGGNNFSLTLYDKLTSPQNYGVLFTGDANYKGSAGSVYVTKGNTYNNILVYPQLYNLSDYEITANSVEEAIEKIKYVRGYNQGLIDGEKVGYDKGLNQGTKDSFTLINFLGNIISVFFSAAFTFLSFEVFGIKLWEIFSIAAAAAVIIVVYRLIKGGGD